MSKKRPTKREVRRSRQAKARARARDLSAQREAKRYMFQTIGRVDGLSEIQTWLLPGIQTWLLPGVRV